MGAEASAITLLSGTTGFKIFSDFSAAKAQRVAIKQQILQERIRRSKEQINADDKIKMLNAHQIAQSTVSGFDYGGSFANITASNIDKFEDDSSINQLSSDLRISSLKAAKEDTYKNAWISAFGDIAGAGQQIAQIGEL